VKIYNLGFVIYTVASLILTVDWMHGQAGGAVPDRVSGSSRESGRRACLANSAAIITDAFPANQRGMALGNQQTSSASSRGCSSGSCSAGLLAPISWRLVFLISVPVGLFGTVWAYLKLKELSTPRRTKVDWAGNLTFALGLILIMVSVTYGIRPYGHSANRVGEPAGARAAARRRALSLVAFGRDREPDRGSDVPGCRLFRIRAFTFGTLSTFPGRGGPAAG